MGKTETDKNNTIDEAEVLENKETIVDDNIDKDKKDKKDKKDDKENTTIPPDIKQKDILSDINVNMLDDDDDILDKYLKKDTQKSKPEFEHIDGDVFGKGDTRSVKDVREQLKEEESRYEDTLTVEDVKVFAETILDFLDIGLVTVARWYAKDVSDAPYELNKKKRDRLIKQLTYIIIKHKMKMPIELLFFVTLVMAYSSSFKKAHENRKEVKLGKVNYDSTNSKHRKKKNEKDNTPKPRKRHSGRPSK